MKDAGEIRTEVDNFISEIKSAKDVFELFELLNYPKEVIFDISFKRKVEHFNFRKEDNEKIKDIYTVLSFGEDLPVFLIETSSLSSQHIRSITKTLSDRYIKFLLILTSDYDTIVVVFPDLERLDAGKHKLKITKLTLLKDELCYSDIDTLSNILYEGKEESWRDVWKKWKEALSVEKVTHKFFEDYQSTFFQLRKKLDKQGISRKDAHGFALQFLNRIMFIYFVSKKRWLKDDPRFMKWLWTKYLTERNRGKVDKNSFYETWLKTIFFEAFNNQPITTEDLPPDVKLVLSNAPFLNGGLFTENDLDKLPIKINDKLFKDIFGFFEKYRFTIREDMPLEYEVAVNPQMLGYVYESLANVAEEIYDRNDMGIFYTPTVEVDFMCRRSLVEYLIKQLTEVHKEKIYEFVFDEDKSKAEGFFGKEELWHKLEEVLDDLSVVDPACGSGAFLVGMLNVLAELYKIIYKNIKRSFKDFGLKSKIIGHSLYGVDVMGWAVHCAELRLWLQLIVETELKKEDLKKHALLPNLNLNLRIGDSLAQEIGGINLHLRDPNISNILKKKLYHLKNEKENYFNNDPSAKFNNKEELLDEEARIFKEIIEERVLALKKKEKLYNRKLQKLRRTKQTDLSGKVSESEQKKLINEAEKIRNNLNQIEKTINELEIVKKNLHDPEKKPFVWDIDFAEIFGDKGGFDIVIGNPPYVRQEKISPPDKVKEEVNVDDKREYKERLIKSVNSHLSVVKSIDKRSDYYLYFYFHGLSILNRNGTFCFITSNSWLDVGYGKNFQEFLLRYVPIIAIYDNQTRKSFAHADINTIIALFNAPEFAEERTISDYENYIKDDKGTAPLSNVAKFVMFKRPFEEVISSKNLLQIEDSNEILKQKDFRVYPIKQEDLLEDGWEYPENYDVKDGRFKKGKYGGNKWGGKYLRAPDIFFTILEKGKGKLVRLGSIAEVRFGIKTGVNEFFYVEDITDKVTNTDLMRIQNIGNFKSVREIKKMKDLRIVRPSRWNDKDKDAQHFIIEKEFLKPAIKSPKEIDSILVNPEHFRFKLLMCHKAKSELMDTKVLKYIEWGETQKTEEGVLWREVPSVSGRRFWYDLGDREPSLLNFNYLINEVGNAYIGEVFVSDNFHQIKTKEDIAISINSSLFWLFQNVFGRKSYGGGLLKIQAFELEQMYVLPTKSKMHKIFSRPSKSVFEECGIDPAKPIHEQEPNPLPDRKELDDIIFDILGLTTEERKEVYWSVCELVKNRLEKARSLRKRG